MDEINYDALRARITAKLADGWRCPICQKDDAWGGADVVAKIPVVIYEAKQKAAQQNGYVKIDEDTGEPVIYVVAIYCRHCGFTPLLNVDVLLEGLGD